MDEGDYFYKWGKWGSQSNFHDELILLGKIDPKRNIRPRWRS